MSNEDRSLSTPKNVDPKELENAKDAVANAITNNSELNQPHAVAPATGTATSQDAQMMRDAATNRANPVRGRTYCGTSHHANLTSRSAGNRLKATRSTDGFFEKILRINRRTNHGQRGPFLRRNPVRLGHRSSSM
jgi:hypothetical protein